VARSGCPTFAGGSRELRPQDRRCGLNAHEHAGYHAGHDRIGRRWLAGLRDVGGRPASGPSVPGAASAHLSSAAKRGRGDAAYRRADALLCPCERLANGAGCCSSSEAVAQTPGEAAGSLLRVGSEIGHLVSSRAAGPSQGRPARGDLSHVPINPASRRLQAIHEFTARGPALWPKHGSHANAVVMSDPLVANQKPARPTKCSSTPGHASW
jgi:hypothetical protein